MNAPAHPADKLPVGITMQRSLTSLFSDIPGLLKLSWPWLLLVGGLTYYSMQYFFAGMTMPEPGSTVPPSVPPVVHFVSIASQIVTVLAAAVMAVGWHRKVLLGELPGAGSILPGWHALRYIGAMILMSCVFIVPIGILFGIMFAFITPGAPGAPGQLGYAAFLPLIAFPVVLFTLAAALRLSLVLPARSIGDNALRFRDAWAATRGNTLRLVLGVFLTFVVPLIVLQSLMLPVLMSVVDGSAKTPSAIGQAMAMPTAILTALSMLISMMGISFLSYAYQHFFGERLGQAGRDGANV